MFRDQIGYQRFSNVRINYRLQGHHAISPSLRFLQSGPLLFGVPGCKDYWPEVSIAKIGIDFEAKSNGHWISVLPVISLYRDHYSDPLVTYLTKPYYQLFEAQKTGEKNVDLVRA